MDEFAFTEKKEFVSEFEFFMFEWFFEEGVFEGEELVIKDVVVVVVSEMEIEESEIGGCFIEEVKRFEYIVVGQVDGEE